jgi:hypothetical protein
MNYPTAENTRVPDEATIFFGIFDGVEVFIPVKEYDSTGQEIISEMIGFANDGQEVWVEK